MHLYLFKKENIFLILMMCLNANSGLYIHVHVCDSGTMYHCP